MPAHSTGRMWCPARTISLPRSQRTADHWFNTAAFPHSGAFHFGNAGRNTIPGPGNAVVDLALHKRFRLTEGPPGSSSAAKVSTC